jgi:hypothetical protein
MCFMIITERVRRGLKLNLFVVNLWNVFVFTGGSKYQQISDHTGESHLRFSRSGKGFFFIVWDLLALVDFLKFLKKYIFYIF